MVAFYCEVSAGQSDRDRFEVSFAQPSFRLSRKRLLNFFGKGTVYLLETGLVADGTIPRISLPFIDRWYHSILGAPTSRTIPYSVITHHAVLFQRLIVFAKVIVFLLFLPAELAMIASLFVGANLVLLLPIAAVALLLIAAIVYGRPHYSICFNDPNGQRQELFLGFRNKALRSEFQQQLTRLIEQAKRLEHADAQSFSRALRKRSALKAIRDGGQYSSGRWIASGLIHGWVLGCAGLSTALFLHLICSSTQSLSLAGSPLMRVAQELFYQPGVQLYALLTDDVVIRKATSAHEIPSFSGVNVFVLVLWAVVAGLAGLLRGVARPNPDRENSTAVRLAIWLPIATVCIFVGWNVRQWLQYNTFVESESDVVPPVMMARPVPQNDLPPRGSRTMAQYTEYIRTIRNSRRIVTGAVERSGRFEQQQNYSAAERELQEALALAQKHGDNAQAVPLIRLIAQTLNSSNDLARSQSWLQHAIPLTKELSGKDEDLALLHNLAAVSQLRLNNPEEAIRHFEAAVTLIGSNPKPEFAQNAMVIRTNYGQQLQLATEFAAARTQFDTVLSNLQKDEIRLSPHLLAGCYVASADNLAALGRSGEAFNHASHAAQTIEQFADQPNADKSRQILAVAKTVQMISFWNTVGSWLGVVILVGLTLPIAFSAGRRGYSVLMWLVVGACSGFPMANLAVLASIPDRRIEIQRQQLLARTQKLQRQHQSDQGKRKHRQTAGDGSVGDQPTVFE